MYAEADLESDAQEDVLAVHDAGRFFMMAGPAVLHSKGVRYPARGMKRSLCAWTPGNGGGRGGITKQEI
jgi:hypothetical protein